MKSGQQSKLSAIVLWAIALLHLAVVPVANAESLVAMGETRDYILDGATNTPKPLIVALHGGGGSASGFRRRSGLREVALSNGMAIVWPDSADGNWNDGRLDPTGNVFVAADDRAFLLALVQELTARKVADPRRIYLVGHSSGGMMSFAMGCKYPDIFRAMVPISANVPIPMDCAGKGAIATLNVIGMDDRVVPFAGGGIFGRTRRGMLKSVPETWNILLHRNGCKKSRKTEDRESTELEGVGCKATTRQRRLKGHGHFWPSGEIANILSFMAAH